MILAMDAPNFPKVWLLGSNPSRITNRAATQMAKRSGSNPDASQFESEAAHQLGSVVALVRTADS